MPLTDVQKALVWHAARGVDMTLTGPQVVEVANREAGLRAELAEAREHRERLTAERDALAVAGNAMAEAINDGVREMPRGGATGGGWPNDPGRRMREALDRWRALAPAATTVREDDRP